MDENFFPDHFDVTLTSMLFVKYVLFIIFVYDYEFKSLALYFAVHVCILTDFALWQICLAAVLSFCFRW